MIARLPMIFESRGGAARVIASVTSGVPVAKVVDGSVANGTPQFAQSVRCMVRCLATATTWSNDVHRRWYVTDPSRRLDNDEIAQDEQPEAEQQDCGKAEQVRTRAPRARHVRLGRQGSNHPAPCARLPSGTRPSAGPRCRRTTGPGSAGGRPRMWPLSSGDVPSSFEIWDAGGWRPR